MDGTGPYIVPPLLPVGMGGGRGMVQGPKGMQEQAYLSRRHPNAERAEASGHKLAELMDLSIDQFHGIQQPHFLTQTLQALLVWHPLLAQLRLNFLQTGHARNGRGTALGNEERRSG